MSAVISSPAHIFKVLVITTDGLTPDTSYTASPAPTRTEPPLFILGLYVVEDGEVKEATHIVRVFVQTLYWSMELFPNMYT